MKRDTELVGLLLSVGARTDLPDKQGVLPLDYARQRRGYDGVIALLTDGPPTSQPE